MINAFVAGRRGRTSRGLFQVPILTAWLAFSLGSCSPQIASHGNTIEPEMVSQIVPGATTQQEVELILGSPSSVAVLDDETWYYIGSRTESLAFLEPEVLERQVVVVQFDDLGVVQSLEAFGSERSRDVEVVERETPTRGNDLTFLQQFLGNIGRFEEQGGE